MCAPPLAHSRASFCAYKYMRRSLTAYLLTTHLHGQILPVWYTNSVYSASCAAAKCSAYAMPLIGFIVTTVSLYGQVLACEATREAMQPYVKVFQTLLRCGAAWQKVYPVSIQRARETPCYGDTHVRPYCQC